MLGRKSCNGYVADIMSSDCLVPFIFSMPRKG